MSFPRYPTYKDSGVEWLGQVPGHWAVTALKRGFDVTLGKMLQPESSSPDDELLPYLRAANIQWDGVDSTDIKQMWVSKRDRAQLRLESGDLLVSEGGDVGRSCLWAVELDNCYFQNSINRIRAHDGQSNRYLYYWMSTIKDKGYIDVLCNKSTIAHFTAEKVAAVPVPLPPPSEQTQIAAFLDRETAKIDELVAEQRRLMELLKEKRQAVISHAVTQGMNPCVPMKPSGIEWLGDVPEHWEVMRLKQVARKLTDGEHISPDLSDEGVPLLSAKDVRDWQIDYDVDKFVTIENANVFWRRCQPEIGDILMVSRGATVGRIGVVESDMAFCLMGSVILCKPENGFDSAFLYFALSAKHAQTSLWFSSASSAQQAIYIRDVAEVPVPIPPCTERTEIASFLRAEMSKFDTLTTEAQRAIDLLQERRTALISAAVTGQIDVREFA